MYPSQCNLFAGEWTLTDLCQTLKVPATILRKRIALWQSHGVIREPRTDCFVLVDDDPNDNGRTGVAASGRTTEQPTQPPQPGECDDDEIESAMESAEDQREQELIMFWAYIVGMLTNIDSMPLERIHQMLKMFATNGRAVISPDELKDFLQRKVCEHELIFAGGVYHLPK